MNSWSLATLGAHQVNGTITGAAETVVDAADEAVDALAAALVCHIALGPRRYIMTVNGQLLAILVTGRGYHSSNLCGLEAHVAQIRQACRQRHATAVANHG